MTDPHDTDQREPDRPPATTRAMDPNTYDHVTVDVAYVRDSDPVAFLVTPSQPSVPQPADAPTAPAPRHHLPGPTLPRLAAGPRTSRGTGPWVAHHPSRPGIHAAVKAGFPARYAGAFGSLDRGAPARPFRPPTQTASDKGKIDAMTTEINPGEPTLPLDDCETSAPAVALARFDPRAIGTSKELPSLYSPFTGDQVQ